MSKSKKLLDEYHLVDLLERYSSLSYFHKWAPMVDAIKHVTTTNYSRELFGKGWLRSFNIQPTNSEDVKIGDWSLRFGWDPDSCEGFHFSVSEKSPNRFMRTFGTRCDVSKFKETIDELIEESISGKHRLPEQIRSVFKKTFDEITSSGEIREGGINAEVEHFLFWPEAATKHFKAKIINDREYALGFLELSFGQKPPIIEVAFSFFSKECFPALKLVLEERKNKNYECENRYQWIS